MNAALLLPFVLLFAADQTGLTERERHPLAPSLPVLTPQEEKRIEAVIDRFILADTGKLEGREKIQAFQEFLDLGPEAIFQLIEGFNRAANMQASCPAVIMGKKISRLLGASADVELLTYAKETIGNGVTVRRHMGVVKDLQFGCALRKTALLRAGATAGRLPGQKLPATMSLGELTAAADKETGPRLRQLLSEAEKRSGPQVPLLLAKAVTNTDDEVSKLGRDLLARHLQRQPPAQLKALLKHDRPEVRAAAAGAAAARGLRYGAELIALLEDAEPTVQQAARHALVRLARGVDHGPDPDASFGDREAAVGRWRAWWAEQTGK
jgi:hypothetical protein